MIKQLSNTLTNFNQLNFNLIPDTILLNRVEKKYLLNCNEFIDILNELKTNYFCLEINESLINNYNNIYFDTQNFDFYLQHHNNISKRLKIRKRFYETTNTSFLEIKQKTNERTFKSRLKIENHSEFLNTDELNFINQNNLINNFKGIQSKVQINYKRLSLINIEFTERLSFDFDIEFISGSTTISLSNIIIAESKQCEKFKSHFINVVKEFNINQIAFSKYCIAISKLYPTIKHNNFKPQLILLENNFYDNVPYAVTN